MAAAYSHGALETLNLNYADRWWVTGVVVRLYSMLYTAHCTDASTLNLRRSSSIALTKFGRVRPIYLLQPCPILSDVEFVTNVISKTHLKLFLTIQLFIPVKWFCDCYICAYSLCFQIWWGLSIVDFKLYKLFLVPANSDTRAKV